MFPGILNGSSALGSRLVRAISSVCLAWRIFATVLFAALMSSWAMQLQAQTTATVTPVAYAQQSNGALQAGDGNFYTTGGALPAHSSCAFKPLSLTITAGGPFTDTLTVNTKPGRTEPPQVPTQFQSQSPCQEERRKISA